MHNPSDSDPLVQTVELKIRPSQVVIAGLTLLAVLGAALLVLRLIDVLILVFVALVIATTLRPMASALHHRGIPKVLALLLIYLGILGVLAGLFLLVIPVLIEQGGALIRDLPQMYASLVASLATNPTDAIRTLSQQLPTGEQLASQLQAVSGVILTGALGIGMGVISLLTQVVSIVVLSIYLTLGQSRLERFWLSLAPTSRRPELLAIWREIESHLGGYVRGEILLMTSIGVLAGVGYLVIGLPFPLALGALAGLLEFVPMIGPTLGAIPAVLVALTISPQAALVVVLYSIVIQVAENNFLVPRLMGHSVGVSPVVVIIAIFAFTSLLGIIGAFLAIPLAAILQVLMDHLVVHAGVGSTEEPEEGSANVMSKMRAQIRRLRAEGLQRLRVGRGRINLATGDRDDVDSRVDHLLLKADQALTKAAQTESTDTAEEHTAHLAEVDQAINQAGEMVEEAKADAPTGPESKAAHLAKTRLAIDHASEIVEEVKAVAVTRRESQDALLVEADPAIDHAGEMVAEARADAATESQNEKASKQTA
jgi:predicted PurR-regulated permease PerM